MTRARVDGSHPPTLIGRRCSLVAFVPRLVVEHRRVVIPRRVTAGLLDRVGREVAGVAVEGAAAVLGHQAFVAQVPGAREAGAEEAGRQQCEESPRGAHG